MGYAAAGLVGIGIGFRVGFFGLLFSSMLALCIALGMLFLRGEPVLNGLPTAALHLLVFELSALAGMAVRHGVVGAVREAPISNQDQQGAQTERAGEHTARAVR